VTTANTAGAGTTPAPAGGDGQVEEVVPARHPGRWIGAVVVVVVLAAFGYKLVTLPTINYPTITHYLFAKTILSGVATTLELAILSQVIGTALGGLLAVMRLSSNPVLSAVSWLYIWFFRGTPLTVQILFWFNGMLYILPRTITLGVFGLDVYTGFTRDILTLFVAAVLALALNEAAYMAEIVRAGILSVDHGQTEAAQALGMRAGTTMRRIVLPQAMRVVIPPTGNEFISMLKNTSLVVVIGQVELLGRAAGIYSSSGAVFELLTTASLWYLAMTSVAYVGQYYLERRFARGSVRNLPPTPLQRLRTLTGGAP
jgi:polar amino acid transport system permease protein